MANSVLSTTTVSAGAVTTVLTLNNTQYIISTFGDLWRMDGVNLIRVAPAAIGSSFYGLGFATFNDKIYYAGADDYLGNVLRLYEWDGVSGWTLVGSATNEGYGYHVNNVFLTVFNSNLYVSCGRQLFVWNGISTLTFLASCANSVPDFECYSLRPVPYGGVFLFCWSFRRYSGRDVGPWMYSTIFRWRFHGSDKYAMGCWLGRTISILCCFVDEFWNSGSSWRFLWFIVALFLVIRTW